MIIPLSKIKFTSAYILLVLVLVIGLTGIRVETARAATITVCPSGCDYTSIQAAVNAASSGDTISIGAGTYDEQVIVNKGLTLVGAGATTIIKPTQATANNFQLFNRLSGGAANSAAIIVTDTTETVVIQSLKVDGSLVSSTPSGARFMGILYRGTPGQIISVDVNGISVAEGNGIYLSGYGSPVAVTVSSCTITNYAKNGITANNPGLIATISNNTVTGAGPTGSIAQNGIQIGFDATGTVSGNTVNNNVWTGTYGGSNDPATDPEADGATGILLYMSSAGVQITNNTLTANQFGIWTVAAPDVSIQNNTITGLAHTGNAYPVGVAVWSADMWTDDFGGSEQSTAATVSTNTFSTHDYGLLMRDYDTVSSAKPAVTITGNTFTGNDVQVLATSSGIYDVATTLSGNTFDRAVTVDHPGSSLLPTIWSKIQDGVNAAVNGDTINVAAGTYEEQVVVAKNVTLKGAGATSVIKAPNVIPVCFTTSYPHYPVVCVKDGATATIDGFTVDGAGKGNSHYRFVGIAFRNAGGTVKNSTIKDIRDTPFSGAQHGVGIYSYNDDATSRNINVYDNVITGFQKNAMALNAGDATPLVVDVQRNTVTGYGATTITAQNGIQVWADMGSGTIKDNTVSDIAYDNTSSSIKWVATSILNFNADLNITGNTVSNGHVGVYNIIGSSTITNNTLNIVKVGVYAGGIIATDPPEAVPSPFDAVDGGVLSESGRASLAASTLNVQVSGNTLSFSGSDNTDTYGIEADAGYGPDDLDISISSNTVSGFGTGIGIYNCTSGCSTGVFTEVDIHQNSISGNTMGVETNVTSPTVNAELNWWGHASGPSSVGPGSGDHVSTNVDYSPWLGAVPGTSPMTYVVDPTSSAADINDLITSMSAGDTLRFTAGTYPGGINVSTSGITIIADPGVVIGPGSHGMVIAADDTTVDGFTFDGTGCSAGDAGIYVNSGVQRVWLRNNEVRDWCDGGIKFAGSSTDVKVVDNYIHDNIGNGLVFVGAAPGGIVEVYGNAFRNNGASGVYLGSGSLKAEYNEWGDIAGPTGPNGDGVTGSVDYTPWVFGKLYVSPASTSVLEGNQVTVKIKMDVHHLFGIQFHVTFDKALLQLAEDPTVGSFKTTTSGAVCTVTTAANANLDGKVKFNCNRADGDAEYDASNDVILSLKFTAQDISGASAVSAINILDGKVKLGAIDGVNIFVDSVTDGSVTVLGTTSVAGRVDLQGRDNDSGAVVNIPAGSVYPGGSDTTDVWGRYDFANVEDGSYLVTIEMARYLDAAAAVNIAGENLTLNTVKLLGGDTNDDDTINISDATTIGSAFGTVPGDPFWNSSADINNDGTVNILDLVLMGGNYGLSSPVPWTP